MGCGASVKQKEEEECPAVAAAKAAYKDAIAAGKSHEEANQAASAAAGPQPPSSESAMPVTPQSSPLVLELTSQPKTAVPVEIQSVHSVDGILVADMPEATALPECTATWPATYVKAESLAKTSGVGRRQRSDKKVQYAPCEKCGKTNHKTSECYAKGGAHPASHSPPCEICGRTNHTTSECYARRPSDVSSGKISGGPSGKSLEAHPSVKGGEVASAKDGPPCERCGRTNHKTSECYARRSTTSGTAGGALKFESALEALRPFHGKLGGTPNFRSGVPHIPKKLTADQLEKSSDYEYVYLTIAGFQALQAHQNEIIRLNNGQHFKTNPGTKRLEEVCGFTMHGDRPGANGILRSAPESLLQAFDVARRQGTIEIFFTGSAFDRTADPCLEGRLGRILAFLEEHVPRHEESPCNVCGGTGKVARTTCSKCKGSGKIAEMSAAHVAPPKDISVDPMPAGSPVEKVVGEYLRVFRNNCIQEFARGEQLSYKQAKALWENAEAGSSAVGPPSPDVPRLCNSATFWAYLAGTGIVLGRPASHGGPTPICTFSAEDVSRAVQFYVDMDTLSEA